MVLWPSPDFPWVAYKVLDREIFLQRYANRLRMFFLVALYHCLFLDYNSDDGTDDVDTFENIGNDFDPNNYNVNDIVTVMTL